MDRRVDRGQATRQHIIATATQLFTEAGYEAVSIEVVLSACGISRGALYHHFKGKEAVFTAVLEATEARVAEGLMEAAKNVADPMDALRAGCAAWLRLAAEDPSVRQIVLTDAPAVIGWQAWRALDGEYSLGLLRTALNAVAAQGRLPAHKVQLYAHVLLAVLIEVALMIARAPEDPAAAEAGREAVDRVLAGLLSSPR